MREITLLPVIPLSSFPKAHSKRRPKQIHWEHPIENSNAQSTIKGKVYDRDLNAEYAHPVSEVAKDILQRFEDWMVSSLGGNRALVKARSN